MLGNFGLLQLTWIETGRRAETYILLKFLYPVTLEAARSLYILPFKVPTLFVRKVLGPSK